MASLTAHLLETDDHGRLGFRSDCPVCRQERLFGQLASEPIISRRAQAVLAGGVLAFSSAAPGAALAQEPDRQREGVTAPEQPSGGELEDPGFDPGGETALPFETAPAPSPPGAAEDTGDGTPLDVEPGEDSDARLVPVSEPEAPPTGDGAPVPPTDAILSGGSTPPGTQLGAGTPPPSAEGVPADGAPAGSPLIEAPPAHAESPDSKLDSKSPSSGGARGHSEVKGGLGPPRQAERPAPPPASTDTVSLAAPVAPVPTDAAISASDPAEMAQTSGPATSKPEPPLGNARFHVVAPGDSLWSIAKRLLGRDASLARIAREVARLWSLNEDRIGTGDPDLVMVGTKLRLR